MSDYESQALKELSTWREQVQARPGLWNQATRRLQGKLNSYIPEKVHAAITSIIKQMMRAVLTGSNYTTRAPLKDATLAEREARIRDRIDVYRRTAAAEGGITGAGGILLGLADFPLLLSIKLKLLFDIAALYGHSGDDYKERVYLLHIFQLAFSSDEHRTEIFQKMVNWQDQSEQLPASLDEFDWRSFQQEYRDYIDLAKLAQLIPVIGAPVGVIVNNRLIRKLGVTAMNAYRMRWFEERQSPEAHAVQ